MATNPGGGLFISKVLKGNGDVHKRTSTDLGQRLYEEGRIADPAHMIGENGKPIVDVTFPAKFAATEKEMTDREKMAWKNYQLYKVTLKLDRRDTVFEALATSDYPHFRVTQHWMGAPFPIIEPHPFVGEVFSGMRWYEHTFSVAFAILYFQWIRFKPTTRYGGSNWYSQKAIMIGVFAMMEFNFGYRSIWRLQGMVPNEPECFKYGICETPDRLRKKAEYWGKFKAYKEEWCRRWDYYMWGMRPGERFSLMSACWMAPWPVRYNTRYDYPIRKNPFVLTDQSIRDMRLDHNVGFYYAPGTDSYIERARPEVKYIWRGGVG